MDWERFSRQIDEFETLNQTMDLNTERGSKVIFAYPKNGHDQDAERASKELLFQGEYTVKEIRVGGWASFVELEEKENILFNTVQFKNKEDKLID